MESKTRQRVGPPPVLAAVMEALVPAAARKGNDGDWRESYISPWQYAGQIMRSIPAMVADQVRRTFNGLFVLGETVILYVSFAGAPTVPLAIVVAVTVVILILRDAYILPHRRSLDAVPHAIMASTSVLLFQIVVGMIAPGLTVPYPTTIRGASICLMLMSAWRLIFPLNGPPDLQPLTARAYRSAWRLNILWMVALMGLLCSNVDAVPEVFGGRNLLLGLMPMVTLGISHWLQMQAPERIAHIAAPLSILADPRKDELAMRQWKLLAPRKTPASGARRWAIFFEALFFVFLSWPLGASFLRWFAGDPAIVLVEWSVVWMNLGAILPLAAAWIYVKRTNRRIAQEIQDDINALNEGETK